VVPIHAKKAQREGGDIAPLILTLAQDGVNRQLHTKATLLLRKEPQYPLKIKLGALQSCSGCSGEEKYLAPLLGFKL